ncbi:M48 family metallopeptidase [Vogesella sp. DC21W]|uniref:M48 family metallopeptidase n=1 Tax=Vogesella aquatica TaxID=2984206 RepID=A0ABT5J0C0_9NEIS|nr:M48 family metallopeptidase [Vogesella aquatica]MDC7718272.1 M48 family metallopeptidase [Vogesella aquatica]
MNAFSWATLLALMSSLTAQAWLARRQIKHVHHHRQQVPASFAHSITLQAHQKAADYTCARSKLHIAGLLLDTITVLLLTFGGGINLAARLGSSWFDNTLLAGMCTIALCLLASSCAGLPLSVYRTFVLERRFGFNRTTPALFAADLLRSALLGILIGAPVLAGALWLLANGGPYFWLWTWLAWCGFVLLLSWAYPTLIAPHFNRFAPLQDSALESRIQALLQRCGFTSKGLFVMDGSRRSAHGNAYFTGLGQNKRIVFFDTLLEQLDADEIEAVLAHELGHFHHGHIRTRLALTFASTLLFLAAFAALMYNADFHSGLNVSQGNAANSLLLFILCAPGFTFLLAPLGSLLSRQQEYQADDYAAANSSAGALQSALLKLYRDNASTLTPDPLHSAFYDSHPPASLRIAHLQGTTT